MGLTRWTLIVLAALPLWRCADDMAPEEPVAAYRAEAEYDLADGAAAEESADDYAADMSGDMDDASEEIEESVGTGNKAERMRHYDASLVVQAQNAKQVLTQAEAIVTKVGGRMTSLRGEDARFKVPVKAFAGVLRKLGKLGKVVTQSIRMEDITEAYQDTALRARLLQTMIAKLEALLAQAKTAGEKIALLKEISALNERLAIIQESKAALKHRAQYSDIALSVQTSPENVATVTLPQLSLFRWLAQTSPDGLPYHSQQAKFEFATDLPGFAIETSSSNVWTAHSPTASRVRAITLPNEPRGSSDFWVAALRNAIGDRYASVKVKTVGKFKRLEVKGADGFHYCVAVHAEGDKLYLVDVFYTNTEDKKRFDSALRERLKQWQS